eukprot:3363788-Alexandrium_andersonii.AAC.1
MPQDTQLLQRFPDDTRPRSSLRPVKLGLIPEHSAGQDVRDLQPRPYEGLHVHPLDPRRHRHQGRIIGLVRRG